MKPIYPLTAAAGVGLLALLPVKAQAQALAPSAVTLSSGALIRFVVVDPGTGAPLPGAAVTVAGDGRSAVTLNSEPNGTKATLFDPDRWKAVSSPSELARRTDTTVLVPAGGSVTVRVAQAQAPAQRSGSRPPIQDIYIRVTAPRLDARPPVTTSGQNRSSKELNTFVNKAAGSTQALTQGQSGVASDSNGQQHVRGEHAEIAYVVDGVPLPDTLSGRQGSIVVPSTIENLDILTGSFAPEFGGQTAAVLNISTLPSATKSEGDLTIQGGGYATLNNDLTVSGPIGDPSRKASYVLDISSTASNNIQEPQQPNDQTAHNAGHSESYFGKIRFAPAKQDTLTLTLSHAPSDIELSNRTGLSSRYAQAGEGYGFLGLRNADGTRPDVTPETADLLGAAPMVLPSQQTDGQAINEKDISEFGTLSWRHPLSKRDVAQLSATVLHSGQTVDNNSPAVDLANLPVDNSIEYNPDSVRNVYHYQINGDVSMRRGVHQFKTGMLYDGQQGKESYQITPGSLLALDALAAVSPNLAPAGTVRTDAQGNVIKDVNGNPVYAINPGATVPTLTVKRSGLYAAAYVQDTWAMTHRLTANYGARFDWYRQTQDLGQPTVDVKFLSPRLNFSYALAPLTPLRFSYNRLMNTPPLAQGAVVGQPIQPETLDQYDVSVERRVAPGQTAKVAYYYKQIHNQVDTGLLIPGSQIGLFSAVNFQYGGVHGVEVSYDLTPTKGYGWDGYVNYSYAIAKPNGLDNTGAPAPEFNDHDQRHTVGAGLAYDWKSGATVALTGTYGSGLASSPIPPSTTRTPRSEFDLRATTGDHLFAGHGGVGLDVSNIFDTRTVINFQSGFSGTRFQQGRRILFTVFGKY